MTELKTLKDLPFIKNMEDGTNKYIWTENLKAEAIKWAKGISKEMKMIFERDKGKTDKWFYLNGKRHGLTEFHNITEKDLK